MNFSKKSNGEKLSNLTRSGMNYSSSSSSSSSVLEGKRNAYLNFAIYKKDIQRTKGRKGINRSSFFEFRDIWKNDRETVERFRFFAPWWKMAKLAKCEKSSRHRATFSLGRKSFGTSFRRYVFPSK